ncbi:hypothetical protein J3459_017851 [Metarhizium acridum]|uniref:Uncharacterized protein n=1 Tax=Metarhizium acridum (strain CQMa 102) TaxID=655827 RepID=E9E3M7_METAQ|nr:uncharacterized protein MAC_04471 [Metarhizium acridum CQMa 102]EFY89452.1 hypothetical protein MAC_04471 [Metarhizium acridum CQMa 102]KAG8408379.1 hypothetical protein J3459_017851 [Metarhizium acridum]
MKFVIASVAALASVAIAAPNPTQCQPATYRCEPNKDAWDVCNTSGQWVFAGNCPPNTVCKFLTTNGSPYCVPPDFTIP